MRFGDYPPLHRQGHGGYPHVEGQPRRWMATEEMMQAYPVEPNPSYDHLPLAGGFRSRGNPGPRPYSYGMEGYPCPCHQRHRPSYYYMPVQQDPFKKDK